MRPIEDRAKYVQLRAEGKSYRAIAGQLGISKDTCQRWEADLKTQVAERKAEQLEDLYDCYHMTREARITQLGESIQKIDLALDSADLSQASPEKLLELKLKYFLALKEEYLPVNAQVDHSIKHSTNYMENALMALNDLLHRVRTGEVTAEQASKESLVIGNILKAIEVKDVKHKLETIETALEGR